MKSGGGVKGGLDFFQENIHIWRRQTPLTLITKTQMTSQIIKVSTGITQVSTSFGPLVVEQLEGQPSMSPLLNVDHFRSQSQRALSLQVVARYVLA